MNRAVSVPMSPSVVDETRALQLLDELTDLVFVVDGQLRVRYANRAARDRHHLHRWTGRPVLDLLHPDDAALVRHRSTALENVPIVVRLRTPDGAYERWELVASPTTLDGEPAGYVAVGRELSHRAVEVDGEDVELLRALVHHSSAMLAVIDRCGTVRSINGAFGRQLGLDPAVVVGCQYLELVVPGDRPRVEAVLEELSQRGSVTFDTAMLSEGAGDVVVELTVTDHTDDPSIGGYLLSGHPVASLRAARAQAQFLENHDPLTGLLNRRGFFRSAELLERQARRDGDLVGVIAFDLDRFTAVNQLYGMAVGDAVIAAVGQRIQQSIRQSDLVCRMDGDRFAVAMAGSLDSVLAMQQRVQQAIAEEIVIESTTVRLAARSAVVCRADEDRVAVLIEEVEPALSSGSHLDQLDGPSHTPAIAEQRRLVDELEQALADGSLQPWFQPIVDAHGATVGFEALLRWVHPERGLLLPGQFFAGIGLGGLADEVGAMVLDRSLAFVRRLQEAGAEHVAVHVNITPRQLAVDGFAASVSCRHARAGIPDGRLCLEITESDVLGIGDTARENLDLLRAAGMHVAIDDFGTGYSSLSHLLELPVDMLKIDRRFVAGLGEDAMATSLTAAIVGLTASVGLECVAEGVETEHQRRKLTELGCGLLQGFLFGRALPPEEALRRVGARVG